VPYQGYPDGLYLVARPSAEKGVDHYGILDIGDRLKVPNADGINPIVVHQCPPSIRADWLQDTGIWQVLGQITDEPYPIQRYHAAIASPAYSFFGHNCEHFARFVATGIHESKQLQAAGWVAGLAVLVMAAGKSEPERSRRRRRRTRSARAA
jgi:hypothetical protein